MSGGRRRRNCPVSSKSKSIRFYIDRSYFPEVRLRDIPGNRIAGISIWGQRIESILEADYAYRTLHGFIASMSYRNSIPLPDSCRSWRNIRLSLRLQVKGQSVTKNISPDSSFFALFMVFLNGFSIILSGKSFSTENRRLEGYTQST